jgi:hypothetical protein
MQKRSVYFLLALILFITSCGPAAAPGPSAGLRVITHPDGPLFVGDRVSFEVLAPDSHKGRNGSVEVKFDDHSLGRADFGGFGIGGRSEAVLWWVWDTNGLTPGPHTLTFTDATAELTWEETVTLHPASQVPPPEPEAKWAETTTTCCILHYITGTDAARDISTLSQEADAQSADIAARLNYQLKTRIDVTLMPRVIGQGGFTTGSVYLSYLDENYMANEMPILFHHEFVHFYDGQIGGDYRPSILEEGLAVYLTGGHFKPEPLRPRAAALLSLGLYIPLTTIANDFYNQQHDIGYLEGATVVQYLVETYGWQAFDNFFRTMPAPDGRKDAEVLDAALQEKFHISFTQLESTYLAWVKSQSFTEAEKADLRLTIQFFDTVRRYQKKLDPSAYFLTAWLPDGPVMRQRGIVADFLRRPRKLDNRALEYLFVHAWNQLSAGQYAACDRSLKAANWILGLLGG